MSLCSCLNHVQVFVLPQNRWTLDFCFSYFIRNVFAATFGSPMCAVFGTAPDGLHMPKSKRRHSGLRFCISSLSYLTQTEGHSSTFLSSLAKGHYALYEWNMKIHYTTQESANKFSFSLCFLVKIVSWSSLYFLFLISPLFSFDNVHECFKRCL